jgi:hypothetical protein
VLIGRPFAIPEYLLNSFFWAVCHYCQHVFVRRPVHILVISKANVESRPWRRGKPHANIGERLWTLRLIWPFTLHVHHHTRQPKEATSVIERTAGYNPTNAAILAGCMTMFWTAQNEMPC